MRVNNLLTERNMSMYLLSKKSGVPKATVSDICRGKARIEKCSAETIYKLAKALDVSMESLIEQEIESSK